MLTAVGLIAGAFSALTERLSAYGVAAGRL